MSGTVLVTGGDGGIGRACVGLFEERGDRVVVLDRARGHDACDPASVASVLEGVDRLDAVVHAAGSVGEGGIEDTSLEQWRSVVDDNLTSAFVVCKAALPLLGDGGSVVLLSSVNGRHGGTLLSGPAYAAAKAGVIGLARHLAKFHGSRGVRVNAIAAGPVATAMVDRLDDDALAGLVATMALPKVASTAEVAGTVWWLCSPAAASVTGTVVDLNGGMWMG